MRLLIAGGKDDPNLQRLITSAKKQKISVITLLTASNYSPNFTWSISDNNIHIEQAHIKIHAAFIRRNVFHEPTASQHDRSLAWYTSVAGYLMTHTTVKLMNRTWLSKNASKLQVLYLAGRLGLNIPKTVITNIPEDFKSASPTSAVAKPVAGGGYCEEINDLMENLDLRSSVTANPAIVQQQIKGDDIRLFRIGERFLGFQIKSELLDYRKAENPEIKFMPNLPAKIVSLLEKLMDVLEMNWGAADFKRDETTGKYYFLEVNSNPMFSAFDNVCGGQISNSILTYLSE